MSKTITQLDQLRIDIDVLVGMGEQIKGSRETATAFTKLQEGRMHIGNTLFELRGTGYDNNDPKNKGIDPYYKPEGLTPMEIPTDWNEGSLIANVKILRRELDGIIARTRTINPFTETIWMGTEAQLYAIEFLYAARVKLREAQNWYGMELGRIRDEK